MTQHPFTRLILRLPAGVVEDTYEFLVSAALAFAGLVQFVGPALFEASQLHHVTHLPVLLILVWGLFFAVGGTMAALGVVMRGRHGLTHLWRTVESIGLSLEGSAIGAYALMALATLHSLSGVASALLLLAIGLGFGLRVIILLPGIYERVLRNELEREVNRITRRK